jgi:SAM-dependent methyltransferase
MGMARNAQQPVDQSELDVKNNAFWDFICGSSQARDMGVVDDGPESLKIFDDWFMGIYPFAEGYVNPPSLKGKKVLEVGLGMGTIGQYAASFAGHYTGLDIANGPVNLMNHRLKQAGLNGEAIVGSILDAPFENGTFDVILAFGCLHHTGNLQRALDECHRILKPGGRLTLMVYHAYGYRRFEHQRALTWKYWWREIMGYRGPVGESDEAARAAADTNHEGEAAPHTDWVGQWSMRHMLKKAGFRRCMTRLENMDQAGPYSNTHRDELLNSFWRGVWGLDLYANAYA